MQLIVFMGVVLLCGSKPACADERFVDNKDGTVLDTLTNLVWVQNPENIPSTAGSMIWIQARNGCNALDYGSAGPGSWRLPNIRELQGLIRDGRSTPRIDPVFRAFSEPYWSSTEDSGRGARAWTVDFEDGTSESHSKLNLLNPVHLRTRCVRYAENQRSAFALE